MNIRISTLLAVLLATPVAALAQNAPDAPPQNNAPMAAPGAHHVGRMMEALRNLNLSAGQMSQIKSIVKNARASNQGVTDRATRKANMQAMRSAVEGVLTPDQRSQLRSELAEMRAERRQQGGGQQGGPPQPGNGQPGNGQGGPGGQPPAP